MIVHIFPKEKFTVSFIKFINKNFNEKEHWFFLYGVNKAYNCNEITQYNNIKDISTYKINFLKTINNADKIIIHSLFIPKELLLYLFINRKVLKRCGWVIWGADMYSYRIKRITLKAKVLEFFRKVIIKQFKYIITLSKNDYKLAKEWYDAKGIYKQGIYINPISFEYLNNIKLTKVEDEKVTNIQIGNSADSSNLHLEIIDILKKFKEENIKIYVPLSYGDNKYALKVKDYGEKIFKDKFVAMLDFMDKDKYGEFLGKIDIAIFNNNRQQALGNIRALAYLGSKIYMRDDTTMWDDFIADGYEINKINNLLSENFEEFILKNKNSIDLNSKLAEDTFNQNKIAEKWRDIFDN